MKVSVKVPATTANIGPGFDCLGMALPVYNIVTIEETVLPKSGIEIVVFSEDEDFNSMSIPTDNSNIAYKAVEMLYNSVGQTPGELKITIKSSIPLARGLGSSASVIVGALMAANELLGSPADEAALLSLATEVEGHPDNITPAIIGGLVVVSQEEDDSIIYRKLSWPKDWYLTVCVPDIELSTDISRSVIPECIPLKDVEFNLRRVGMFIHAVDTHDEDLIKLALQDKIHHPYRQKIVPGFVEIKEALKYEPNLLGCVLSGAGPSILVITNNNKTEIIKEKIQNIWADMNIKSYIQMFPVEEKGAVIV